MNSNNNFTFIDLFAGIGGFRMALNSIGGECLNFSEINKDAINTYCTNFNEGFEYNLGDITKIKDLPAHDLLTGGVPCQSWSIAGRNLGFDDDRGQLWNDTIYLLNKSKPKAFVFENVKGLVDPRNKEALTYILQRIKEAGYFANYYLINSFDYGVPQNRLRIYIIGFREEEYSLKFSLPKPIQNKIRLGNILTDFVASPVKSNENFEKDLFGEVIKPRNMSLSNSNGFNDYFLFNDLRNGHSTIHSWDILDTTDRQKEICYLLLKNRRKSAYGNLDGNPLSYKHFKDLDQTIGKVELDDLVSLEILKKEGYSFLINEYDKNEISEDEKRILECNINTVLFVDYLKTNRDLKLKKISISKTLKTLQEKNIITPEEIRYDFKNTKISTGLYGINRIFLPTSNIFPTLVASDTNDYITTKEINANSELEYREKFLKEIYKTQEFRRITKKEACLIQGFPEDYLLPENRARWMKLIGNSVSVPVIEKLGKAIVETGVFDIQKEIEIYQSAVNSSF
ncbi:DNA (cytosine-5-)-methyltransferase [Flavobacterium soyangense]|uniref:Cytosine-specific methyltransferase n=1 Tax=Flavobacterium soyangense TaxID=2023265 RepID=A0A930UCY3_9FLAO|nr:DNA (cytosine-5-)-methyltransferase [Flavobacterium soyangense]MBF2709031.1 DNA (cytosine-5-)-methyltransferase [Flavobacterium soyangense]